YHKAVDLWRRYREAAAAVRAFADHHETFLHALRPNDAPEAAQVSLLLSSSSDSCTLDRVVVATVKNCMTLGFNGSHGFRRESSPLLAVGSVSEAFHRSCLGERFRRI
ncbi:jg22381, partial [Pararge aegeria aegeria]